MLPRKASKKGPLLDYVHELMQENTPQSLAAARSIVQAVRVIFATPEGAILRELLEKTLVDFAIDPVSDPRACDALNAQRLIAFDLRRIESDESDRVLQQVDAQRAGRRGQRGQ